MRTELGLGGMVAPRMGGLEACGSEDRVGPAGTEAPRMELGLGGDNYPEDRGGPGGPVAPRHTLAPALAAGTTGPGGGAAPTAGAWHRGPRGLWGGSVSEPGRS